MKVHWRLVLAVSFTIGVVGGPFSDGAVAERIRTTMLSGICATIFWALHWRHETAKKSAEAAAIREAEAAHAASLDDAWARRLGGCRRTASTLNEVLAGARSEAVKSWADGISADVEGRIERAADLAALGRSLEPEFDGTSVPRHEAAKRAWDRLGELQAGLAELVGSAAEVRFDSSSWDEDLEAMRTKLEMLKSQLPVLDR